MQNFDVIICGAGPAGTTCALGLFNAGLNVALIDKQTFPREKVCGDAYGGYTHKILNTISTKFSIKLLAFNKGVIIKNALFTSPKGREYNLPLIGNFTSVPRYAFDDFLLTMVKEETNTTVLENTSVQSVIVQTDKVTAILQDGNKITAKIIVGCDGAHSVVQSALTYTRKTLTQTYPGIRAYYKNVQGLQNNRIEIYFLSSIPKGYLWIFPSTNGCANVGIGADKKMLAKKNINLRKEFHQLMENSPQFKQRFANAELVGEEKGWTIPIGYFNSKLSVSGNRVLLCGDAAAMVEPATGEGIGPAMSTGRFAAWQIKKCFATNDFSGRFMKKYDAQLRKKYFLNYFFKSLAAEIYSFYPPLMEVGFIFFKFIQRFKKSIPSDYNKLKV